jgi:four helix bundle protein
MIILMSNFIPIQERSFQFAVRIVKFCMFLDEYKKASKRIADQLQRSGTSIGANIAESQSAQSERDFIHKLEIALKEAKETQYWLKIILEVNIASEINVNDLLKENNEIIKILSTIILKGKKKIS